MRAELSFGRSVLGLLVSSIGLFAVWLMPTYIPDYFVNLTGIRIINDARAVFLMVLTWLHAIVSLCAAVQAFKLFFICVSSIIPVFLKMSAIKEDKLEEN